MEVKQEIVEIINRQKIEKYTIINDNGVQVGLLTLGATWQEFLVPDDKGGQKNLIIGFDEPSDYLKSPYVQVNQSDVLQGVLIKGKLTLMAKKFSYHKTKKETLFTVVQKVSTNTFGKQELKMILTKPLLS